VVLVVTYGDQRWEGQWKGVVVRCCHHRWWVWRNAGNGCHTQKCTYQLMLPETAWLFSLVVKAAKFTPTMKVDYSSNLGAGKNFLIISKGLHGVYIDLPST